MISFLLFWDVALDTLEMGGAKDFYCKYNLLCYYIRCCEEGDDL